MPSWVLYLWESRWVYVLPAVLLLVGLGCAKIMVFEPHLASATQPTTIAIDVGVNIDATSTRRAEAQPELNTIKPSTTDQTLQIYEKLLADECKNYRDFLDRLDDRIETDARLLGGGALAIVFALLTWFGFRDRRGLRKYFKDNVDSELEKALNGFRGKSKEALDEVDQKKDSHLKHFEKLRKEFEDGINNFKVAESSFKRDELRIAISQSVLILGLYEVAKSIPAPAAVIQKMQPLLDDIMQRLDAVKKDFPGNRYLAIQRARFDEEYLGNLAGARDRIDAAWKVREKVRQQGEPAASPDGELIPRQKNKDDAALLYNLACYSNKLSGVLRAEGKVEESEKQKQKAQDAIDEALALCPEDIPEAKKDEYLNGLRLPD
jgi:hypothetical protein